MKALQIKNLKKSYLSKKVLKSVTFDIEKGDFFALL
jgi:ABC-type multidrug transport system ATPase subunit